MSKAVFLSYASQDADAARRICDALRGAGVEVWFDQSELRGGDSWDAKIRKQIKECALFVPIISANTNSRPEGYFRLEWKLAVDRSHLLADDHAFLFPVVIDETAESTARVPEKFRDVQWTRLNVKDTPETLAKRVGKLLDREGVETGRIRPAQRGEGAATPRKPKPPAWLRYAWILVGLAFSIIYVVRPIWRESHPAEPKSRPVAVPAPGTRDPAAAETEARRLVRKARDLFFFTLDASKDDFALAEDLMKQAVAKAPDDAEVWAAYAQLHERYMARGWDQSNERREAARVATQRALRLDPKSFEARLAVALSYTGEKKDNEEREQMLRALLVERPDEKRVLRGLAGLLRFLPNHAPEVLELYDRAAKLPGGDPLALYNKALALWFDGRAKEADAAIAASLAQQPFIGARLLEAFFALTVDGDLDRAQRVVAELPSASFLDDRGCFFAYLVHRYRNEPDQALAVVQVFSRDWISDNWFRGPRGLLAGNALAQSGRPDAAAVEWRAALKVVDQRLAANPSDRVALGNRLLLLAQLGETTAARELLRTVRQMLQASPDGELGPSWFAQALLALGERAEVMRLIDKALQSKRHAIYFSAADLRYEPVWAPLRGDPEFTRLIAEAERVELRDAAGPVAPAAALDPANAGDGKSVAVLAFTNLSDDKGNEYYSDGVSEELLNVLAKIPDLKVSARTSAFSFKGRGLSVTEIARQLGVAYVIEGSVRRQGDKVRITAQLIRAANDFHVWSDAFTRDLKDIFAVQEEIAGLIAKNFSLTVGATSAGTRPVDPEAYRLLSLGRSYLNLGTVEDWQRSRKYLQAAVERDPKFALAWAFISRLESAGGGNGWSPIAESYAAARVAAGKALALDPSSAEAHVALGVVYFSYDWDWARADIEFQQAAKLAPGDVIALSNLARIAIILGRTEESIQVSRRAFERDPLSPYIHYTLSMAYFQAGRFEDLAAFLRDFPPATATDLKAQVLGLLMQGRNPEALAVAEAMKGTSYYRPFALALAYWANGRVKESDAALNRLKTEAPDLAGYQIAQIYAQRNDREAAFQWLETSFRLHDTGMIWLKYDPVFRGLQADPRWAALIAKMKFDGATAP